MANDERDKYTTLNWGVDCTKCVKRGQCSVRGGVAQKCEHGAWNESLGMVLEQARQVDPLFANRVSAAYKRELAAKVGEIAAQSAVNEVQADQLRDALNACEELKRKNFDLNGCLIAEQELAEKRNELIKEMADALDGYPCHYCKHGSDRCDWCDRMKEFDSLVAKAREVCHA